MGIRLNLLNKYVNLLNKYEILWEKLKSNPPKLQINIYIYLY